MKISYFLPPILLDFYKQIATKSGWYGDFKSWEEVEKISLGYDKNEIIEKVTEACLKVKNGEAIYERDSVLFDKIQYSWPLLAGLCWIASFNNRPINVVDFGGSLGSTYFQNRKFLSRIKELTWNIVEQEQFIEIGKKSFESSNLSFSLNISNCIREGKTNVLLLSSVIQYIKDPKELVSTMLSYNFDYIIIDRTSFIESKSRLTIQKVDPKIYEASYPCWFFNEKEFVGMFLEKYLLIEEFLNNDYCNLKKCYFKGFIFEKKANV